MVPDGHLLFDHIAHGLRKARPGTGSLKLNALSDRVEDFTAWADTEAAARQLSGETIPPDPRGKLEPGASAGRWPGTSRRPSGLGLITVGTHTPTTGLRLGHAPPRTGLPTADSNTEPDVRYASDTRRKRGARRCRFGRRVYERLSRRCCSADSIGQERLADPHDQRRAWPGDPWSLVHGRQEERPMRAAPPVRAGPGTDSVADAVGRGRQMQLAGQPGCGPACAPGSSRPGPWVLTLADARSGPVAARRLP
jgi:hypothetical protein